MTDAPTAVPGSGTVGGSPVRPGDRTGFRWRTDGALLGLLAAVAYLPLLVAHRGVLNADVKLYLYLDPAGLLRSAPNLWNSRAGGGSVTHQTIGYLWPMGPFYRLTNALGVPDWVAQRLWYGTILFAAAAGAYVLFRSLRLRRSAATVGALVYGLSPFVLGHITGQSALLLPFAGLPWLVLAVRNACRADPWRWAAVYALVVTTVGSLNGSAVFYVLAGSVLWIPFAVWHERTLALRAGVAVLARLALLTVVTQLWWLMAYRVGGRYGLPILQVTETVRQTSETTSAAEVLRGLGYWFFYGGDNFGPWLRGFAEDFTQSVTLVVVSFAVPVACLTLGWWSRARERLYFVGLVVLGVLGSSLAFGGPERSVAGRVFESASRHSGLVLSLRNSQRAAALVALGVAGLGAIGLTALLRRAPRLGSAAGVVVLVLTVATFLAPWRDALLAERYTRPEAVPQAWVDAGHWLDREGGRALLLPGADFGAYRWGHTLDPVLAGLTRTELIWREQLPMGGVDGVDLVATLDRGLQTGTLDPATVVPVARALGVRYIVVANDLETERYRLQRPELVMDALADPATGLTLVATFGDGYVNVAPGVPVVDEKALHASPAATAPLPQVAIFEVPGVPRAPVEATAAGGETVVHGDAAGAIGAAAAGLLDPDHGPVLTGDTAVRWKAARRIVRRARQIVTDTNRRTDHRYTTLLENDGATQATDGTPGSGLATDLSTTAWNGTRASSQSVVVLRGARSVDASAYGNPVSLLPETRPALAFDDDPTTVWSVDLAGFRPLTEGADQWLRIDLGTPSSADHVDVVQPAGRIGTAPVTRFDVVLDGDRVVPVTVDAAAATAPGGVRVALDGRPFRTLEVRIPDDGTIGAVAISEVRIPGVRVEELVRLPRSLRALGPFTTAPPLAFVLSRQRADASITYRSDAETAMRRLFEVPVAQSFVVSGTAHVADDAPDPVLDALFAATPNGTTVTATERLAGDPTDRPSAAVDGDLATWWSTPLVGVVGQAWSISSEPPLTIGALGLDVVVDERHSLPTELTLEVDGITETLAVPALTPSPRVGATQHVTLALTRPLTGREVTLTIRAIAPREARDLFGQPVVLPVAFAEIGVAPTALARPSTTVDTPCRTDLLTVDDVPVAVRVHGDATADGAGGLQVTACGAAPLALTSGEHVLRTAPGSLTGLDLDLVALVSPEFTAAPAAPSGPAVRDASYRGATVTDPARSTWIRLDQSANAGWTASAATAATSRDLGSAHSLDLFAAGWLLTDAGRGPVTLSFAWGPQGSVDLALVVSALGVLACLALIVVRRRSGAVDADDPGPVVGRVTPLGRAPILVGVATVVVGALFADLVVGLALLIFVGAAEAVARLAPRARAAAVAVRVTPLAALVLAVALVATGQDDHRWPHTSAWPEHFRTSHLLTLFALLALAWLVWSDRAADTADTAEPGEPGEPTGAAGPR